MGKFFISTHYASLCPKTFRRSKSFKECGNWQPGRQVSERRCTRVSLACYWFVQPLDIIILFSRWLQNSRIETTLQERSQNKAKKYRPISLLPLISKVTEKVIHNQTQNFSGTNIILYRYQSGFRKHYSTDTCLSFLTDKVRTRFEKGLLTGMVLIDLQKAFDTIGHGILLDKMNCLGFSNSTVAWFNSYLTHWSFILNVGKEYSSPGKLSCGVPQGSILVLYYSFCM